MGKPNPKFYPSNTYQDKYLIRDLEDAISEQGNTNSVLAGVTQSGKTNALIYIVTRLFQWAFHREVDPYVLYVSNESSNALKEQTYDRFFPKNPYDDNNGPSLFDLPKRQWDYLERQVDFVHRDNLKPGYGHRIKKSGAGIVLFDESHIAINDDGQINRFLKECGVDATKPSQKWNCKSTHLINVSATCYTQVIQTDKFETYVQPPGKNHVSIIDLYENDKVRQIDNDLRNDDRFLKKLFDECKNENKHLLLRYTGTDVDWIYNIFEGETIKEFSSDSNATEIRRINEPRQFLGESAIFLIRGGLRVGITLNKRLKRKIGYAVDTNSAYGATVVQSLPGRMTGYPPENTDKNDWIEQLPRVYCNVDKIEEHLEFEKSVINGEIPKVVSDSGYNTSSKINYMFEKVDEKPDGWTVDRCSNWKTQDIAGDVLKGKPRHRIQDKRVILLDGPNIEFEDSWTELLNNSKFDRGDMIKPKIAEKGGNESISEKAMYKN